MEAGRSWSRLGNLVAAGEVWEVVEFGGGGRGLGMLIGLGSGLVPVEK